MNNFKWQFQNEQQWQQRQMHKTSQNTTFTLDDYKYAPLLYFPHLKQLQSLLQAQSNCEFNRMKNSINNFQAKKIRGIQTSKRSNFTNTLVYKQMGSQLQDLTSKIKNNKESNVTISHKQSKIKFKEQDKPVASKKNSLHQLGKKNSKVNISTIQMMHIHPKLNDNYLIDTQEQSRFEPDDTKQLAYNRSKKQSLKYVYNNLDSDNSTFQNSKNQSIKSHKGVKITLQSKINLDNLIPRVQKNMFNYLYIIGKGGFGKVWKVQHKKTKNQYAMKEMLKSIVMTKKSVQSVMNQRVLLSQFTSPFVVNMHFAFQDRDTMYLMLDLMEGGDLRYHIGHRIFNELQSKFFIACIILGLQDLQKNNIIHRDIKPQNLVLDSRGYIRITDLGIARIYKHNNSCDTSGTPGYMSPQVICRMNHHFVSDYFALGVIAFELMTGKRPYNGRSRNQIRDLMLAKQVQLKQSDVSEDWSYEAADFINKLIQRKPQNRLGYSGITEIKNHPWLDGLYWQKLRTKEIQSPFIPMMKKSNFDQDQQITIEDQQQAELIQKSSLLLRKPEFQQLFNSYYYDIHEIQKQKSMANKRIISAYRKSQNQKQLKPSQLNDKKASFNEVMNRRKLQYEIISSKPKQKQRQPISKCVQLTSDSQSKDKKRISGVFMEKSFFKQSKH